MSVKLSFCIPTLNFGPFIGKTLRSIFTQAGENIQIIVVDGGSTDDTVAIVSEVIIHFPNIKLIQRTRGHGIDLDILESVRHADGDYCWLFSSDDILLPGAITRALRVIDEGGWDVFLMGMTLCDLKMRPLCAHPILACKESHVFDWSDVEQRSDYFARAQTSTAFFSFISDIVVHRDSWLSVQTQTEFIGSCWIIAAQLFAMSQRPQGIRVRFDPEIYLHKRGDNDSFAAKGLISRIELSIVGFRNLGRTFFGQDSFEASQISRVVSNEYPLIEMLSLKCRLFTIASHDEFKKFYQLARLHATEQGWRGKINYLVLRLLPLCILLPFRPVFRIYINILRFLRA